MAAGNGLVMEPVFRTDMAVRYVSHMGDDYAIIEDARTSLRKPNGAAAEREDRTLRDSERARLVDFFRYRHASVLRGCVLKVEVEVPIFVQRQLRTHWVGMAQGWSENDWLGFNDQSGRYARNAPHFWLPQTTRLEPDGFAPMAPSFSEAGPGMHAATCEAMKTSYVRAFETYRRMVSERVAREVARAVLPEGTYVAGRITGNLNAWLGLLSLRIDDPGNAVQTHPQAEVAEVARAVEEMIRTIWPETYAAWAVAGRGRP